MGKRGLQYIITDSWEARTQNWTDSMITEFTKRRGYDMIPWMPVLTGYIVESSEASERFLWDLRLTAQELIIENHAERLKLLGHQNGFRISIRANLCHQCNQCSNLVCHFTHFMRSLSESRRSRDESKCHSIGISISTRVPEGAWRSSWRSMIFTLSLRFRNLFSTSIRSLVMLVPSDV